MEQTLKAFPDGQPLNMILDHGGDLTPRSSSALRLLLVFLYADEN